MAHYKKEAVTASFHYLTRNTRDDSGEIKVGGFTDSEFDDLASKLLALGEPDLDDDDVKDRIRLKKFVPIEAVERIDTRLIFGTYWAAYWGHAYRNTAVGKIPADSISLRPFYFLIYRSKKGHLFLGVQYLGQFGSYEGLRNTLARMLHNSKEVVAHSFRNEAALFENIEPVEVHFRLTSKAAKLEGESIFKEGAMLTFRRNEGDVRFGKEVRRHFMPSVVKDGGVAKIKKAASDIINESGLMSVADEDIADATVVGKTVTGRRRVVYMMQAGQFASQFHLDVTYNEDGHPDREPTKAKMLELLDEQIIDHM